MLETIKDLILWFSRTTRSLYKREMLGRGISNTPHWHFSLPTLGEAVHRLIGSGRQVVVGGVNKCTSATTCM